MRIAFNFNIYAYTAILKTDFFVEKTGYLFYFYHKFVNFCSNGFSKTHFKGFFTNFRKGHTSFSRKVLQFFFI